MESKLETLTGVTNLRDAMLQELGIYEMYRLMKLYHDWESVVGPMVSGQAKLAHIKPPVIVVEIGHTVWMQEMTMRKPQLLEALREYYGESIITDIKVQLPRHVFQEQLVSGDALDMRPIYEESIDFHEIVLSPDVVKSIEDSVRVIRHEELRQKVLKTRMEQAKKEFILQKEHFHQCPTCGRWQSEGSAKVCPQCEYKKYRHIIRTVKGLLKDYPHYKYDQMKAIAPWCTYEWYEVAKEESIYYYLTRLFQGSTDANDMYWATMLITSKPQDELSYEQVVNITNKYRWNEENKMQVK